MSTIRITAKTADRATAETDISAVAAQDDLHTAREIEPSTARAIAAWWQSPGSVGQHLAALASGASVDRTELLEDIRRTRNADAQTDSQRRELDVLATFVIHCPAEVPATFGDLAARGEFVDGVACIDCTAGIANGDWPEIDANWTAERETESNRVLATFDVTLGHLHAGEWSTCFHAGEECEVDCDCERTEFSSRACDICGTALAGYRHDVTLFRKADLA